MTTVETMGTWAFIMLFSVLWYILEIPIVKKMLVVQQWITVLGKSLRLARLQFPLVCRTIFTPSLEGGCHYQSALEKRKRSVGAPFSI